MPAIDFFEQFADGVEHNQRRQTIRRRRKRPIKIGDELHLFTGMCTKACRKLRVAKCVDVQPVYIGSNTTVIIDNRLLTDAEKQRLANDDGFDDFNQFYSFYKCKVGLPLDGHLIKWR